MIMDKDEKPLKMYILLRDFMDPGHSTLTAAHASLAGY
ncbi:unnamed protein product, partial [marine sediment metagenome]